MGAPYLLNELGQQHFYLDSIHKTHTPKRSVRWMCRVGFQWKGHRMTPIVQSVIIWIITGLLGAAVGAAVSWWRGSRRHDRALEAGVRELLLCKLEQLRAQMVAGGGVADEDLKSRSQRIYDAYHGLDGNGHGTAINDDIQHAPIRPRG